MRSRLLQCYCELMQCDRELEETYQRARHQAAKQTRLEISVFSNTCPYSLELVLTDSWLPED
ncbi:MAG: DUF29 domain-containing protein [Timaviella obliquedivisa GSE-PSE-MK23-08B]|nr:DUF29 domain-containing protein [Timaviella obliquedivisa GSE-PSE-MK23-08B]